MTTRRLLVGGIACATTALLLRGGIAVARPLDDVVQSGVLRVALYRGNAPFSDDPDGKPVGIDVDIARRVAEKLGLRADIRIVEASENVDGDFRLNLWRGDLAGSALADVMLHVPADKMLQFRNEQVAFTAPYAGQQLSIAYRRGSVEGGFQDLQDIQGKSVAVEGTSPVDALIGFANGGVYRDSARHYLDFAKAAAAFFAGEADFLAGTRVAIEGELFRARAGGAAARLDDVEIKDLAGTGLVKPRWELCGAVRVDSRDLAYRIGDAFSELASSGDMKALFAAHGATYAAPAGY